VKRKSSNSCDKKRQRIQIDLGGDDSRQLSEYECTEVNEQRTIPKMLYYGIFLRRESIIYVSSKHRVLI
jgi:hypothetical protein